jgi:hypothetical protein
MSPVCVCSCLVGLERILLGELAGGEGCDEADVVCSATIPVDGGSLVKAKL